MRSGLPANHEHTTAAALGMLVTIPAVEVTLLTANQVYCFGLPHLIPLLRDQPREPEPGREDCAWCTGAYNSIGF
jgi:hypothetical protein